MAKKTTPIISIRVTDKEKEQIKEFADKGGLTITDYIKQKALYDVTEDADSTSNTKDLQSKIDAVNADNERLNDIIKSKDDNLKDLREQLKQANIRIDDYSKHLDQQQQLHQTNQLKLESMEQKEQDQRKGFFSRLFSRD